ncbi:OmpA/MotB family protein [Billgrantia endophytica]|uniref:Cell envelope biogenesis protein OmpA n=1 Tax=Billgrantia endophytica TaxID=2033802 RepID=A0A2N7TV56_9GAMM|nr:OmpA family protein [Halomonas endophytica]PMR72081.1 cell envelope biogenesis protein OmpA [Halomonas endophytica]
MSQLRSLFGKGHSGGSGDEHHWLSVSDLMAGLMMVFLFISIALMRHALLERDRIKEVAVAYQENQVAIYDALMEEFEEDLEIWQASVDDDTLAFTFQSPEVLFATGSEALRPRFQQILDDFFPRYLDILLDFSDSINEVRVEGHTSSRWAADSTVQEAYFNNMELSQGRTRSVLGYLYDLPEMSSQQEWIKANIAAVGFSSSRVVLDREGNEDPDQSRRVSFRVITNAETQIRQILDGN